jgi:hypothetical protein
MAVIREFSGIDSEDYVNPETQEYVSVPLSELYKSVPQLKLRNLIKRICFKEIKDHHLQIDAYYPKVKNKYQITSLGLIQVAELIINPKLGFTKTIEFLTDGKELLKEKTGNINHAYNQKIALTTQSVSEIVSEYFRDKDPVWLNKQLRKAGWIIHHKGNQWEATPEVIKKGYAQTVWYYGNQYVRYTQKGVDAMTSKLLAQDLDIAD